MEEDNVNNSGQEDSLISAAGKRKRKRAKEGKVKKIRKNSGDNSCDMSGVSEASDSSVSSESGGNAHPSVHDSCNDSLSKVDNTQASDSFFEQQTVKEVQFKGYLNDSAADNNESWCEVPSKRSKNRVNKNNSF